MFGIPGRAGKVPTVAVPGCAKEAPMARIRAAAVKGSVFHADEFTRYNDVKSHGKHVPVNHAGVFADGPGHINGIAGFRSSAERLYRPCHGVDREHVPLDLAGYESRYHRRDEHLPTILFEALVRPQRREGGLAQEVANHRG